MTLTEFVMKFKKLLIVLIYFISIGQAYAADVTISGTQDKRRSSRQFYANYKWYT